MVPSGAVAAAGSNRNVAIGARPVHDGGGESATTMVSRADSPVTSTTVRAAVKEPPPEYVCVIDDGGAPLPVASGVASPNDKRHESRSPSGSELADPSNVTTAGARLP